MILNHLLGEPHWDEVISEFNCTDGVDARLLVSDLLRRVESFYENIDSFKESNRVIQSGKVVRIIILNHYLKTRLDYLCPQVGEKGMQLTRKEYHIRIMEFIHDVGTENDLGRLFKMVLKCNSMIVGIKGESSFANFLNELRDTV